MTNASPQAEIIAECEINHNGDVELGKKLITAAKDAGASSVKFQCMKPESFIAPGSSFMPLFKDVALSLEEFRTLKDHAAAECVPMFSTAVCPEGLKMILDLDFPKIKIGSTNITHSALLEAIAESKKPVYLSTGASNLAEIERALAILSKGTDDITLFHCTALYPAKPELLNMASIETMRAAFPGLPIAYSDHSVGNTAAIMAVAMGAVALEKHFTTDQALEGPDHKFSADPEEFASYVQAIREAETMLGVPGKKPAPGEDAIRRAGRRYLTALTDIAAGTTLDAGNTSPRRIMVDNVDLTKLIEAGEQPRMRGWKAACDLTANQSIAWADLTPV